MNKSSVFYIWQLPSTYTALFKGNLGTRKKGYFRLKHTDTFNGPFSGTTQVSRYQKGKPIWILLNQETVSGSGISWALCKSAPRSRQITMPAPHHSDFYRLDAIPVDQPTASKHWSSVWNFIINTGLGENFAMAHRSLLRVVNVVPPKWMQ